MLELERKAHLFMILGRKGGPLDSKRKEDKAPTLFQAEVRVQLSAVVAMFYIRTVQQHPTRWLFTHML